MRTLRSSPSLKSWLFLPSALTVLGRSKAMRGGLVSEKPGGGLGSGSLS
jgi:hypothetical protein